MPTEANLGKHKAMLFAMQRVPTARSSETKNTEPQINSLARKAAQAEETGKIGDSRAVYDSLVR